MQKTRAARRSCSYRRAYRPLVKPDRASIARMTSEHERYDSFTRGGYYAAALMCAMFIFLSVGCVVFGW